MNENNGTGGSEWTDPDDAPEFTAEMFDRAELREGNRIIRRGNPPIMFPGQQVSIQLDPDVLERLHALGPEWMGRMNELLRAGLDISTGAA